MSLAKKAKTETVTSLVTERIGAPRIFETVTDKALHSAVDGIT